MALNSHRSGRVRRLGLKCWDSKLTVTAPRGGGARWHTPSMRPQPAEDTPLQCTRAVTESSARVHQQTISVTLVLGRHLTNLPCRALSAQGPSGGA